MKFAYYISIILVLLSQFGFSQTKNEKEERIKASHFPESAKTLIKSLPKDCKHLKFYKETDNDKRSYEIKFKYKKQRFSLEFSEDGKIEDIEVLIKFKKVKKSTRNKIEDYLKNNYQKHKLIKIQKQFIYSSKISPSQFVDDVLSNNSNVTPNFEIIAEVKSNKKREVKEFTFNNKGEFMTSRPLNPTSYEHVLY